MIMQNIIQNLLVLVLLQQEDICQGIPLACKELTKIQWILYSPTHTSMEQETQMFLLSLELVPETSNKRFDKQ